MWILEAVNFRQGLKCNRILEVAEVDCFFLSNVAYSVVVSLTVLLCLSMKDQSELALLCGMVLVLRLPVRPDCIDPLCIFLGFPCFQLLLKWMWNDTRSVKHWDWVLYSERCQMRREEDACKFVLFVNDSRILGSCMKLSVNDHVTCVHCSFWWKLF